MTRVLLRVEQLAVQLNGPATAEADNGNAALGMLRVVLTL